MQVRRSDRESARRLRSGGLWICLLAGVLAAALTGRPWMRAGFAQSPQTQAQTNASGQTAPANPAANAVAAEPVDPQKRQIADDSANLLKLANNLKAEVDKTTADTLSVAVIRQAGEIEKLAHKMRTK